MCDPVTATLAIASTAYGLYEQRKAAKKQEKFYAAAAKERHRQIFQQKSAQADDRARRARVERSRLRALSAETGLAGITTTSVLNHPLFQSGQDIARIDHSLENDLTSSTFDAQSNLNRIQQPDYIGAALNTGLQLYSHNEATKAIEGQRGGGPSRPLF